MKKALLILAILIITGFLYLHQTPILNTREAIVTANEHLDHLPDGYDAQIAAFELNDIPAENVTAELHQKDGLLNELFNKNEWLVTIKNNEIEVWIIVDAQNGAFIEMGGQLN